MSSKSKRIRLDQILIREGLITEEQIKEALTRQKAHGGKIGSQLLYHRYIDEQGLVKALAIQFGCQGVVLPDLVIPEVVLKMIPPKIVLARKVVPFDYIPDDNLLKVACEDPTDDDLRNELGFVARGKDIEMYVAAELAIDTVIARHYQGRDITLADRQLLQIPEDVTSMEEAVETEKAENEPAAQQPVVLICSDEQYAPPLMQSLLERDGYQVKHTDSADDAIEMIGKDAFHTVFIKDTVSGDYLDLIDRLRKNSPRTRVRYYESASNLLLDQGSLIEEGDLLVRNLELFTSLLALQRKIPINHSGNVGRYADLLCKQLGIPDKDRLVIVNAAYLHDLSKHYYSIEDSHDQQQVIKMTVRLLQSINYSPTVVGILRSMYKNLGGKFTKRLPIETLGGNILTIADLFCEAIPDSDHVSLDKFEVVKKKTRDLVGKLFLTEVVEAFITMVHKEILTEQSDEPPIQVMIYSDHPGAIYPVEQRIKSAGFRTISQSIESDFMELVRRSEPEMAIMLLHGDRNRIYAVIDQLTGSGMDLAKTPTFLLVQGTATHELTDLMDQGIEDILGLDVNLDLLITKMRKLQGMIQQRKTLSTQALRQSGASGQLTDMNLIDLLQALGPGQKTVRIDVKPADSEVNELVIYLNTGQITHAKCGELTGAKAVYEGLAIAEGFWQVTPLTPEQLPTPNNSEPNESILMEGCRLIDERLRAGQLL